MASYDGTVRINTKLNTDAFKAGVNELVGSVKSLAKVVGVGFSIAGLVKFGKECTELASDLEEVQNVVDTAFSSMSYKMEAFAKTSVENFGMSKLSAKQMGSTFMAMAKGMGQGAEIASDMAIEMTARMGDVASFYNKTLDEVNTIGRAVYSGETEPLKQIGVIMTETQLQAYALANGYKTLYKNMSANEKLLVRQQYFLEATSLSAGDFQKTQKSWANQTKILSEQWKEFMSILGSGLTTVLAPVLSMLNSLVASLISVGNAIGNVMSKVFGIGSAIASDANKASDSYAELTDNTEDYTDATNNATKANKKALASFDSLEVVQKDTSSSSTGDSDSSLIDTSKMQEESQEADNVVTELERKISELKSYIEDLFTYFQTGWERGMNLLHVPEGIGEIEQAFNNIKESLQNLFTDTSVLSSLDNLVKRISYNFGLIASSIASVGTTIGQNLFGGLSLYLDNNSDDIKKHLTNMFDINADVSDMAGQFTEAFATIFSAFGEENGQQLTANIIQIFSDAFMNVREVCAKFGRDLIEMITQPFVDNKDVLKNALNDVLGVLADITGTMADTVKNTFKSIQSMYDKYLKPLFDSIANGLSEIVGFVTDKFETILLPTFENLANKFEELMSDMRPYIDNFIDLIGVIGQAVQEVWEDVLVPLIKWVSDVLIRNFAMVVNFISEKMFPIIKDFAQVIDGVVSIIKGTLKILIGFLKGIFKGEWEEAWNMIKDGFSDIWEGIKNVLIGMVNKIIDTLNALMQAIVDKLLNTIINKVNAVLDNLPFGLAEKWEVPTLSAPTIPRLANGAVIKGGSPFLAVLGDQKSGQTNIETPLDTMVQAFRSALSDMDLGRNSQPINLNINGETFARLTLEDFMNEANRQGYELNLV